MGALLSHKNSNGRSLYGERIAPPNTLPRDDLATCMECWGRDQNQAQLGRRGTQVELSPRACESQTIHHDQNQEAEVPTQEK